MRADRTPWHFDGKRAIDRSCVGRQREEGRTVIDRSIVRSINSRWKVMPYPFIAPLCRLRQLKKVVYMYT